ncbi:hypothetical protein K2Y11_10035 [bacterium]|nr:hypothetical protein [bacterium]
MAKLYQLDIMRKTGSDKKQTSYEVVAKILIIDSAEDDDDKWMMMEESRGTIDPGSGNWFRSSSLKKVVLTGKVEHGLRNEASLEYETWPLKVGQMGKFTTWKMINIWDATLEYTYFVYSAQ